MAVLTYMMTNKTVPLKVYSRIWEQWVLIAEQVLQTCNKPQKERDGTSELEQQIRKWTKVPHSEQVLQVWKAIRKDVPVYSRQYSDKVEWKCEATMRYEMHKNNFFFDVLFNNGACNCSCGTGLLSELIKKWNEKQKQKTKQAIIDIRTVESKNHVSVAVNDGNEMKVIELTTDTDDSKCYSETDYKKSILQDGNFFIAPQEFPNQRARFFNLMQTYSQSYFDRKELTKLFEFVNVYATQDLQVELFLRLIAPEGFTIVPFTKGNEVAFGERMNTICQILSNITERTESIDCYHNIVSRALAQYVGPFVLANPNSSDNWALFKTYTKVLELAIAHVETTHLGRDCFKA